LDFETFRSTLGNAMPPPGLTPALEALWWNGRGDWHRAHDCAQARDDGPGMRVHAYLHRKEGDSANAGYWYRRSGVAPSRQPLDAEWEDLVRALLTGC